MGSRIWDQGSGIKALASRLGDQRTSRIVKNEGLSENKDYGRGSRKVRDQSLLGIKDHGLRIGNL